MKVHDPNFNGTWEPQKKLNEGQEMERSYLSSHEGDSQVS